MVIGHWSLGIRHFSRLCRISSGVIEWGLFAVVCCLFFNGPAAADSSPPIIEEAVREYTEALDTQHRDLRLERFRRAQRLFSQAIEQSKVQNAALYVNLGNAALQGEQLGQAILSYRRALWVEPGHSQARQNLTFARQLLPEWVPRPQATTLLDTFLFWQQTLSRSGRALVTTLCFAAASLLLAVAIRWTRTWARNAAILFTLAWLALTALSGWTRWTQTAEQVVITVPEVVARAADSAGAPARFAEPLPAGTEAQILERRADWLRIRLANGRDAWVRSSAVTPVHAAHGHG